MDTKLTSPIDGADKKKKENNKIDSTKAGAMAAGAAVVGAGGVAAAQAFMHKNENKEEEELVEETTTEETPVVEKIHTESKHADSDNPHKEASSTSTEKPVAPDPTNHGGDTPTPDTPGTDVPGGDTPGTDVPGGDTPGTDVPGGDTPGTDVPAPDTPGNEIDEIVAISEVDTTDSNPDGFITFQEVDTVAQIDGTESTYATFTTEGSDTQYAMIDLDNDGVFDVIIDEAGNAYTDDVSDVMVSDAEYMINSENNDYLAQSDQEGGDVSITGESFTDDTITV